MHQRISQKNGKICDIEEILLEEVYKLEENFNNYLVHEGNKILRFNNDPIDKVHYYLNLCSILGIETFPKDELLYLINFNYTIPFDKLISENIICNNVHGTTYCFGGEGGLFGIDCFKGNYEEMLKYQFTKTYRKMLMQEDNVRLPNNVDEIYFYGHSLAEADYSYFQSLFDYYDIYSSNVKLFFCYSEYGSDEDKKNSKQKKVVGEAVLKLIGKYGNTFDNKDKGRNLLHKLLLESRLQLREVSLAKIYN